MKTDIEIAREAKPKRIEEIASSIGISGEYLEHYGKFKGKVNLSINDEKLIVTKKLFKGLSLKLSLGKKRHIKVKIS